MPRNLEQVHNFVNGGMYLVNGQKVAFLKAGDARTRVLI